MFTKAGWLRTAGNVTVSFLKMDGLVSKEWSRMIASKQTATAIRMGCQKVKVVTIEHSSSSLPS